MQLTGKTIIHISMSAARWPSFLLVMWPEFDTSGKICNVNSIYFIQIFIEDMRVILDSLIFSFFLVGIKYKWIAIVGISVKIIICSKGHPKMTSNSSVKSDLLHITFHILNTSMIWRWESNYSSCLYDMTSFFRDP